MKNKYILLFLPFFIMILFLGVVSSFDWDNIKTYNHSTLTITITNAFGFGDDIEKLTLISHTPTCSYNCESVKNITLFTETELIDNIMFLYWDREDGWEETTIPYQFYWLNGTKEIVVDDYEWQCEDVYIPENETYVEQCEEVLIGNHVEIVDNWEELELGEEFQPGDYVVKLTGVKNHQDIIDWKVKTQGLWLDEWAIWGASEDNIGYWRLDESSGVVVDALGVYNGTNNGATRGVTGKINDAFNFDGTNDYVNLSSEIILEGQNATVNLWAKSDTASQTKYLISQSADSAGRQRIGFRQIGTLYQVLSSESDTDQVFTTSTTSTSTSTWQMLTFVRNSSYLTIYVNGIAENTTTWDGTDIANSNVMWFGSRAPPSIAQYWNGTLDEIGIWNRSLSAAEIQSLYNGGVGLPFGGSEDFITVVLDSPANDSALGGNQSFIVNATPQGNLELANGTVYIWYDNGTLFNTYTQNITGMSLNTTNITITDLVEGNFIWNERGCGTNVTGTFCDFALANWTFSWLPFTEGTFSFNPTTLETDTEIFYLNITTTGATPTSTELIYNGTTYTGTITSLGGNQYNLSRTIDIPTIAESKPFFWNITLEGTELSTSIQNQIVNASTFSIITTGTPFLNVTFKNETISEEDIMAAFSSTFNYYLGSGTVFKTYTFTNTSENLNYQFALVGVNRTITANASYIFSNSITQQRSALKEYSLTNTTTTEVLYLLPTVDGIFVTFQVINVAEQVLSGVIVNASKGGNLMEAGVTDDAGIVTFFLNPNTEYDLLFGATGYDVFSTSLVPTQTSYTITLGTTVGVVEDYQRGIIYSIAPTNDTLNNNTNVIFNFTISSGFWDLDEYGYTITNSSGTTFNTTSDTTSTGGTLLITLNTGSNTDLTMNFYWIVDGNYTNGTRSWRILWDEDMGYGIRTFFVDLSTYLNSGLFGLTSFGLGLITFLIIFVFTGIMSFKYGLRSPAAIMTLVFTLVLFLDVGVGLMPNPVGAIPNFPTILMGLVLLGVLFKEV